MANAMTDPHVHGARLKLSNRGRGVTTLDGVRFEGYADICICGAIRRSPEGPWTDPIGSSDDLPENRP